MNPCLRVPLLIVFLVFHQSIVAQTPVLDSLQRLFHASKNDSIRWEFTAKISTEYAFVQVDSAAAWAQRGHDIAKKRNDKTMLGRSFYQLGIAMRQKQNLPKAMEYFLKAIALFDPVKDEKRVVDTEFEMNLLYQRMGDFVNAKKYLDRFYQYYLNQQDAGSIIFALNQYNLLYEQMGKPDSMLFYAKETLKTAQQYNQTKYISKIHNNLAASYMYLNDFANAKKHFREAEQVGFGNDESGRFYNLFARADMYFSLGQADSSLVFAQRALESAKAYGDMKRESQVHQLLSKVYAAKNDYRRAYEEINTFFVLEDSLTLLRHEQNMSELNIQYETQKKEAQIAQQQLQLQQEANRRHLIIFGALGCLLVGAGAFLYLQNRQKIKQQQTELNLKLKASEAEQLRELDQIKSNFFANISHEFRTPLTLLLSPLRDMYNGTFRGDEREYQKMMIRNSERLLALVNQLLDLSHLESGRMQLETRAADLTKFVRSIVFSFESWAMRKQLFFQTNFPEQPVIALFDSDKLEKILSNLLSNAFKFTPEKGRVNFELRILNRQDHQVHTQITVTDTGVGIPPEQLPHIFERFYSQPREEQDMRGSGIGLALTKELVELYGGSIQVESELNKGTRFTILMPFRLTDAVPVEIAPLPLLEDFEEEDAQENFQRRNHQKPLVLIVEDNPDLRTYIKHQLQNDYQLVEAVNGKQGLDTALEAIPDLVLTDVMMPEMDGMTLCTTLKDDERTSHVPVVMLTARSEQQDRLTGLSTGADAYLTKPFDPQELQIVVHQLIEQRRKLREKFAEGWSHVEPKPDFISPAEDAFLKKVAEMVEAHLDDENFSIEDLGRAIGMSRSQLHRKIRAVTNQSPSIFVRTLRLQHAYRLLEQKAGNISEVAFQVGIPNLAYFSRSFSEQFGFPPSDLLHRAEGVK